MKRKGVALILSFVVIMVLLVLGEAILGRSVSEWCLAQRYVETTQSFWLAEAGLNRTLKELRSTFSLSASSIGDEGDVSLGKGGYEIQNITTAGTDSVNVTVRGYVTGNDGSVTSQRFLQATMSKYVPSGFYENAIYSAGIIDLNGSSYTITAHNGDSNEEAVLYADSLDAEHPEGITGTETYDPTADPLPRLDFQQLRTLSQSQGNHYAPEESPPHKLVNTSTGLETFPSDFWYTTADDSIDNDIDGEVDEEDEWVPNIVYVESDLQLNGEIGTVGGFFVVVGDVITNPDETQDTTLNGNGMIEGTIYTRGTFDINGGGGNLNVNGGVWAGEEAELNGNAHIAYNQEYMNAIQNLNIDASVQITSWSDVHNTY